MADDDFTAFYRTELPAVVRHVMNHGAAGPEAADAAQTAFTLAYPAWATIRHPRAWLRTVATREFLRSQARAREVPTGSSPLDGAAGGNAMGKIETSAGEQAVLEALAGLPYRQREVMAWHFDGFSPAEIAGLLGADPAAVRQNLARARRTLGRRLGVAGKEAE